MLFPFFQKVLSFLTTDFDKKFLKQKEIEHFLGTIFSSRLINNCGSSEYLGKQGVCVGLSQYKLQSLCNGGT